MCFDKRCNGEWEKREERKAAGKALEEGRGGQWSLESAAEEEDERRNKMASVAEGRHSITLLFFAIRDI